MGQWIKNIVYHREHISSHTQLCDRLISHLLPSNKLRPLSSHLPSAIIVFTSLLLPLNISSSPPPPVLSPDPFVFPTLFLSSTNFSLNVLEALMEAINNILSAHISISPQPAHFSLGPSSLPASQAENFLPFFFSVGILICRINHHSLVLPASPDSPTVKLPSSQPLSESIQGE